MDKDDMAQRLQQAGHHLSQKPEGPQASPFAMLRRAFTGHGKNTSADTRGQVSNPAGASVGGAAQGSARGSAAPVAALAVPLPPVLPLDPAHLLVEADLDVGFTRSDIHHQIHEFGMALHLVRYQ